MRTLGIDLASQPKDTGVCIVAWGHGRAVVEELFVGANDDQLLQLHERSDATGIDSPFGWPLPFVRFVSQHCSLSSQFGSRKKWTKSHKDALRLRLTDLHVRERIPGSPMSVSSDKIGVAAMRCAGLLVEMGVMNRSGDGRVYEVYPAAALHRWSLPNRRYKGKEGREPRTAIWTGLKRRMPWLDATAGQSELIVARDDALDALIAALIARAAKIGLTVLPSEHEREWAVTEGWIHVPLEGSLERLNTLG